MTYSHLGLSLPLADVIGWTLIHFLWQGLLLAALLQAFLPLCRRAEARHNWALATLAAMCVAPVITFLCLNSQSSSENVFASGAMPQSLKMVLGRFEPASIAVSWSGWLVSVWLAGILLLSVRALGGLVLAQRLRQNSMVVSGELHQRCRHLQRQLAMTRPIQFLQTHFVMAPVMVGWLKPAILLPVSAISGLTPQQLDSLILHELAHIRRWDGFTNIMLMMAETILFYHPAIWWVSRRVRIEREHCCDDFAVAHCGDATIYVEALTSLAVGAAAPAFALPANGGALKYRVARLLGVPSDSRGLSLSAIAGTILFSIFIATVATAQITPQVNKPNFSIRVVDENVGNDPPQAPANDERARMAHPGNGVMWLKRGSQIGGDALAEARVSYDHGRPVIDFRLTQNGAAKFAEMTRDNIGHRLAVVVNGTVITAPTVMEPMLGGGGQITGDFTTEAQANALVAEMMGTNHPVKP